MNAVDSSIHETIAAQEPQAAPTPQAACTALRRGNASFLGKLAADGGVTPERFEGLARNGQHPLAVVLTCSDSRVQPVLLFDMTVGDLFVVRAIGGFVGEVEEASVEYGVEHLEAPLVVVLGHTHCGLVKAAVEGGATGAVKAVADRVAAALHGERDPREAERINVRNSVAHLLGNEVVAERVAAGKLAVVGAIYNIVTGSVEWL